MKLHVSPAPISVTPNPPPDAHQGQPYSIQFVATGGSGGGYQFSASGLNNTGLELKQDGTLSGTPVSAGDIDFVLTVVDSASNVATF